MAACWKFVLIMSILAFTFLASAQKAESKDDFDDYDSEDSSDTYYDEEYEEPTTPVRNHTATKKPFIEKKRNFTVYSWGKWSKWGKCSRGCGGGVQVRIRMCKETKPANLTSEKEVLRFANNITKQCKGIYRRFRICNDKRCGHLSANYTFRDQQCAAFNKIPFEGELYKWKGLINDDNECDLHCQTETPAGGNISTTLGRRVIDGTPCARPAVFYTHFYHRRAVCVEGICKVKCTNSTLNLIKSNQ